MKSSIRIFRILGIPIYIHITFLILPVLFYLDGGLKGLFLVLFVFSCVALHELFHSLTARRLGVQVRGITLFPIGGVASIASYPKKPSHEFLIAIAGPSFNVIFTAVFFYPLYKILGPQVLFRPSLATWPHTIAYAFWVNPWLALFNLLPAFPMDGGRILRSFLARRLSFLRATRIAVGIGNFFALLFGLVGVVYGRFMLIVIAVFIYVAAQSEEFQAEIREGMEDNNE